MVEAREIEIQVGRRTSDGTVRLTTAIPNLLTISVSYRDGSASTVMLTHEQVEELRRSLDELEPLVAPDKTSIETQWNGNDRRNPAA